MLSNIGDPFKFLGVEYSATLNEIREKFKKLVLKYHPDRPNGNVEYFMKIKKAYSSIYNYKLQQEKELKKQQRTYNAYKNQRDAQLTDLQPNLKYHQINQHEFNDIFENTKIRDLYDEGRGDFLKTKKINPNKLKISIIKEPEYFDGSLVANKRELGKETVNDYSTYVNRNKNQRNIPCSDLKFAYENRESVEKMGNTRADSFLSSKKLQNLQKRRNNITHKMSKNEKEYYRQQEKQKNEQEYKRRFIHNRQQQIVQRQFERLGI